MFIVRKVLRGYFAVAAADGRGLGVRHLASRLGRHLGVAADVEVSRIRVVGVVESTGSNITIRGGTIEAVGGSNAAGIGDALYRAKITLSTGELFAWTFVIILLSAGFEKLFLFALDKAVGAVLGEEGAKC